MRTETILRLVGFLGIGVGSYTLGYQSNLPIPDTPVKPVSKNVMENDVLENDVVDSRTLSLAERMEQEIIKNHERIVIKRELLDNYLICQDIDELNIITDGYEMLYERFDDGIDKHVNIVGSLIDGSEKFHLTDSEPIGFLNSSPSADSSVNLPGSSIDGLIRLSIAKPATYTELLEHYRGYNTVLNYFIASISDNKIGDCENYGKD